MVAAVAAALLLIAPGDAAAQGQAPPETTITDGPPEGSAWGPYGYPVTYDSPWGTVHTSTDTFRFASDDPQANFECRIRLPPDPDVWTEWEQCDAAGYSKGIYRWAYFSASGRARFAVRAVAESGEPDSSPAERGFTIDVDPPETTITGGPPASELFSPFNVPPFTFTSSEPGSTFDCRTYNSDDPGDYLVVIDCASPLDAQVAAFAHGHSNAQFVVWATDALGNVDPTPARQPLLVDAIGPQTGFNLEPSGPISDPTPTFDWWVDDPTAEVTCRIDDEPFRLCPSPAKFGPLPDGEHTFAMRASDSVGNRSEMSLTVILVDTHVSGARVMLEKQRDNQLAVVVTAGAQERTKAQMLAIVRVGGLQIRLKSERVRIPGRKRRELRAVPRGRSDAHELRRALRNSDRVRIRTETEFEDRLGNSTKRARSTRVPGR